MKKRNLSAASGVVVDIKENFHEVTGEIMLNPVNAEQDQVSYHTATREATQIEDDQVIELQNDLEFASHEAAYQFYQQYAKTMGFTTSIKNSRRSKKSKDFIDAKFACSRYGSTPESETGSNRRPGVKKTDCKASMHVKKNKDGKWVIHDFVKEHNHELMPALAYHFRINRNVKLAEKNNIDILHAVSERTKKMYSEMSRQSVGFHCVESLGNNTSYQFEKGKRLVLEEGDAQMLLDYFMRIKKKSPKFFHAIHLNEDQQLRNVFWVDEKSRVDYASFSDVVSFDMSYMRSNEKMPLALFIGVNHHFQPMLLGCALLADETRSSFVWLMKTWVRAMNGKAPEVMVTDHHPILNAAIEEVFPDSRHCFHLWNILEKVPENLDHVVKRHENFPKKFNKCIFKSCTEEQYEMRWWKMVGRFDLQEEEWVRLVYADRKKWVPLYMSGTFLAGMSTSHRSESVNSFFDKYIHRKMSLKEFVRQYGAILQNRCDEEAVADFDTLHKQPALKSPSPWEKQMSSAYTHAIFRKFQIEVLGVVGCHPRKESEDGTYALYRVEDCEKNEVFMVEWNEANKDVSCLCRSFEYRGFLCRHAMVVLQIYGVSSIPTRYLMNRWTKAAKNHQLKEGRIQTRVQHYNELCKLAIELSDVGSLCQESYDIAFRALADILKKCVNVNDSNESAAETSNNTNAGHDYEEGSKGIVPVKMSKKKNAVKRRKVPQEPDAMVNDTNGNMQLMSVQHENVTSDGITLNSYYGSQHSAQEMVQLNLMEPPHNRYYVSQGLGHLNSIAPAHDAYFGGQQGINELGPMDFRSQPSFPYTLDDDHNLRSHQLHVSASRDGSSSQFQRETLRTRQINEEASTRHA